MFGKKKKAGLLSLILAGVLTKRIGTAVLVASMAGGLIKVISGMMAKKKPVSRGVYGAVAIAKVFKGANFPMTKEDIIEKYGSKKIEYHIGKKEKLKKIIENIPDQTFNRTTELEHALHELKRKPE